MALNNTYFEPKKLYEQPPIPDTPGYVPPSPPTPVTPDPGSVPTITPPSFSGTVSVQFYISASDDDVLDKNITASGSAKTITIKDDTDILDFTIPFNDTSIIGINYASMLNRYYFCEPIMKAGELTALHFKVDALMSWKDEIKNLSAIIDRTGSNYNTYLPDGEVKITSYNNIHRLESTAGFSQALNYYLLTVGDSGN